MGLTKQSTGAHAMDEKLKIIKESEDEKIVALGGNPNVGKSTVFNNLTGLKQHTGNWPGKTVTNATGKYNHRNKEFILVDIPGTYSLMANSEEEEVARDFICFGNPDVTVIVVDATCLERNLNLVLQTIEITNKVIVCVNLMDEAKRKGITVDLVKLSLLLGIPTIGTSANLGQGLSELMDSIYNVVFNKVTSNPVKINYDKRIENAISIIEGKLNEMIKSKINSRWLALKLLENDTSLLDSISKYLGFDITEDKEVIEGIRNGREYLNTNGINCEVLRDEIVSVIVRKSEKISKSVVSFRKEEYNATDRKVDKILTSKKFGIPIMILLLGVIFWLTITGANYPSQLLSYGLFWIQDRLSEFFVWIGAPAWVEGILVQGMYKTLAWVVAVMLPPMAIFFPLFTLLEDLGYLPRIAFNLDNFFKKSCAWENKHLLCVWGLDVMQQV